jgi:glycosyltransferase involved in cell wall biosynthesis
MFLPRLRKVRLKRLLDGSLLHWLPQSAAAVVVTSEHERRQVIAAGGPIERIVVRGNGFPSPESMPAPIGMLREELGLRSPLILYVGRIADGKGIELLLEALRRLPQASLALIGPDDGHSVSAKVEEALRDPATKDRLRRVEPTGRPLGLYGEADVFVLPSAGESFGMVAAEAAAAGTAVVVTDRCGVAEWLGDDGALVVPYDADAVCDAVRRVLEDDALRHRLEVGGRAAARRASWSVMADRQEAIYREALAGRR